MANESQRLWEILNERLTALRAGYLDELDFGLDERLGSPAHTDIVGDIADLITRTKGLNDIHDDLVTADGKVSYTEDSVSGNSGGDGAWHDALDVDTRGMKDMTIVMHNTDGANSLDWRLRARYADYAAGADEEIIEAPGDETLTTGTKGLATLLRGYSRIKVQVKDTVPASAATYTVNYLINR